MSGDDLGSKFSHTPFEGGGVGGLKIPKFFFFLNQLIVNLKLYNISKNQLPRFIRRGDTRGFLLFDIERELFPPVSPPN